MVQEYRNRMDFFKQYYESNKNTIMNRAKEHHVANRTERTKAMRQKYISYQDIMRKLTEEKPKPKFKPVKKQVEFVIDFSD